MKFMILHKNNFPVCINVSEILFAEELTLLDESKTFIHMRDDKIDGIVVDEPFCHFIEILDKALGDNS